MTQPAIPDFLVSPSLPANERLDRMVTELCAANERLNGLLGSISESFIALDCEWRFRYANRRVLDMTGKEWPEIEGRVIWDVAPEAVKTEFKTGYETVMRERVPLTFEVNYPQRDGAISHYQVHAY